MLLTREQHELALKNSEFILLKLAEAKPGDNIDGKCDACGKDMPTTPGGDEPGTDDPNTGNTDEPKDDEGGLGTGAIVVGSVLVVGVGGFALVWFVIKKKNLG